MTTLLSPPPPPPSPAPAPAPDLPTLPQEILLQILGPSHFPTPKSLLPILYINKHLYTTLLPHLYRKITIRSHSPRQRYPRSLSRLARTIRRYPERGAWVWEVWLGFYGGGGDGSGGGDGYGGGDEDDNGAAWMGIALDFVLTLDGGLRKLRIESRMVCAWPCVWEGFSFLERSRFLRGLRELEVGNVWVVPGQFTRLVLGMGGLEKLDVSRLDLRTYGDGQGGGGGDVDGGGMGRSADTLVSGVRELKIGLSVFELRAWHEGIFDPFRNLRRLALVSDGRRLGGRDGEFDEQRGSLERVLKSVRGTLVVLHLEVWGAGRRERIQINFTDFTALKELKIHDSLGFSAPRYQAVSQLPKIYSRCGLAARLPPSLEKSTFIFDPHVSPMRHIKRLGGFKPPIGMKPSLDYKAGYKWILELGEAKRSGLLGGLVCVNVLERKGMRMGTPVRMSREKLMVDKFVHHRWDVPNEVED